MKRKHTSYSNKGAQLKTNKKEKTFNFTTKKR